MAYCQADFEAENHCPFNCSSGYLKKVLIGYYFFQMFVIVNIKI